MSGGLRRRGHRRGVGGLLAGLTLVALFAAPAPAADREVDLSFSLFNGSHSQPGATVAPVVQGPLTVHLSSPTNTLIVKSNRLHLTALADGTYRAVWTAEFLGKGTLVADLDVGGVPGRFEDELLILPQTRTVAGRVRFAPRQGGYEVTIVELPPSVGVAIQSRVGASLVTTCERLDLVPLMNLDCAAFAAALATAVVPLPAAGEVYVLPAGQMTAEERRQLDEFLAVPAARPGR